MRTLRSLGFDGPFPGARHAFMQRENVTVRIPNPHEGDVGIGLLGRILAEAGVTRDEWEAV